jgi:hypothetical protein
MRGRATPSRFKAWLNPAQVKLLRLSPRRFSRLNALSMPTW